MSSQEQQTPVELLLFDPTATYNRLLTEAHVSLQIQPVVRLGDFERALAGRRWDAVLVAYAASGECLKIAEAVDLKTPVIVICETQAEAEHAFRLSSPVISDVIKRENLERLPFILRRERRHAAATTDKYELTPITDLLTEHNRAAEKIRRLNRTLTVLSDINQAIVRQRDIDTLFAEACKIAVEKGEFRMAWIGLLDSKTRQVKPVAQAGFTDDYVENLNISLDDEVRGRGPTGTALRSGQHVVVNNVQTDTRIQPWRDDALRLGYNSTTCLPLMIMGEARGVLALYHSEIGFFDEAELRLLDEMAGDLSFAMEFAEREAQSRQVQLALLESEGRYHRMLDDLLEGAQIIGFDWRYLYVNDASAAHGRMPKELLLKSTILELYPGIENSELFAYLRTCMEQRTPQHFEDEFAFPDGTRTWFELSVQPIPEGIFILSLDITERKRSEIALQRYAKRMEILHQIDIGLIQGDSVQTLIQTTLKHLRQIIPCQAANVTLIDHERHEGEIFALDFKNDTFFGEGVRFPLPDDVFEGYDERGVRLFNDIRPLEASSPRVKQLLSEGLLSLLSVFLTNQDKPIGSLVLVSDTIDFFNAEYQEIAIDIANQLAIAIRQMRLSDEIQQSESQYRLLAENMADVVWMLDTGTSRFTYVSPSVQQLRGYTPQEVMAQTLAETVTPASLQLITEGLPERIEAFIAGDAAAISQTHEVEQPRKDGSTVWTEVVTTLLKNTNGSIRVLGVTRDITERRQSEADLREREEWIRLSMEASGLGKWRYDIQSGVIRFDERARGHYGIDRDRASVDELLARVHPDDIERFKREMASTLDPVRQTKSAMEYRVLNADGSIRWISALAHIYFEGHGDARHAVYGFGTSQDITERKQAEDSLRKIEVRQRAILTAIPDIMFRYRIDGTFLEYHAPDSDLLAAPPEVFLGQKAHDILSPELAKPLLERIQEVITTKAPIQMEYELAVASGIREFESRLVPLGDDEVLAIVRDVTERKLAERELQSLYNATSYLFKADSLLALGRQIVATVVREFEHADCGLMLLDKSKNNILRLARTGQSDIRPDNLLSLQGQGLVALAMRTGEVVYAPDVSQNSLYISSEASTQSEFVVPLKTANGIIGALDMQHAQKDAFSERDRRILTAYAERAAPAIEIMRLYEELNRHAADLEWRVAQRTVELNYAKERAEAILNHSADGIILLTSEMRVEQTNAAFNEIFAAWDDAYFEQPFVELIDDEEKERIDQILRGISNIDKKGKRLETRARRKDGTVFDAELGIGFIKNKGFVCIIRDISERKRAERAIAEERNLLRTLIDALPDYIYVKDTNHKTLLSNLARTRSFGLESPEATIGKDDYAFVSAEMAAQFHADEDQLFKTLEPLIDREERTIGPKGDVIWAATTKVPLHNLNGELIGLVGVTRDISERKSREQQLRFDAGIQASINDAVVVTDMQFHIQSWNKAAEIIYGWSADEVVGKHASDILRTEFLSAEDRGRVQAEFLAKGHYQNEVIQQRKDGTEVYIQTSANVFREESGNPIGIVTVSRDITERKKAEEALSKSEELLRTVLNILPIGVWILDHAGMITFGNPEAQKIWAGAQYVGVEEYGVFKAWWVNSGKILEPHEWGAARAIANGETSIDEELEIESFDHTRKIILNSAVPLRDDEEKIIGAVVLNQDITERKKAEQTLRESETRFRSLFASAPIATVITNQKGEITLINEQAENIFGYSAHELVGQSVDMLVPSAARSQHPERRASYIAEPRVRRMSALKELNALRKDGTEFPVEIELSYVQTQNGLLVMSFVSDVTERKKAEQALRESEMRFGLLVNGVRDYAIYLIDPEGKIVTWNQGAERIKGYNAHEIIGNNVSRFYTKEAVERGEPQQNLAVAASEGHYITEGERVRKDGTLFWAEVAVTALKDSSGRLFGYAKVTRDLTERRKAQETLRLSEERYRLLAENITDIISRVTLDGIYRDVSPSSKVVLGYTSEELIGKDSADFIHPDDKEALVQKRDVALRQRNESPLTYRFRHQDGHYIWLEVARKFIIDRETNAIKEYVTSARDITIRKRAEEALKNALEKEKELGELKSRFVSMASHEFRTPLATILATTETLSAYRSKLSENQIKDKLDKIGDQVHYLRSIIEDTLQVARLQDPKAKYEPVSLDLDAVCRSAIDEFESRPDVTQHFVYSCDSALQEVWLDRKLIRQMLSNLLSNAVKYSATDTTITVTLAYSETAVTLKVQDEGIGIPEADLKHLFEPFHRAVNVGTTPGTGLGLVIAKEAVVLHGGLMTVNSQVGVGTTFTIMIPFGGTGGNQHDKNSAD